MFVGSLHLDLVLCGLFWPMGISKGNARETRYVFTLEFVPVEGRPFWPPRGSSGELNKTIQKQTNKQQNHVEKEAAWWKNKVSLMSVSHQGPECKEVILGLPTQTIHLLNTVLLVSIGS